jgi:hypothetical protein
MIDQRRKVALISGPSRMAYLVDVWKTSCGILLEETGKI